MIKRQYTACSTSYNTHIQCNDFYILPIMKTQRAATKNIHYRQMLVQPIFIEAKCFQCCFQSKKAKWKFQLSSYTRALYSCECIHMYAQTYR